MDPVVAPTIMNNTWKGVIVAVVLLLCITAVAYLLVAGVPDNSLHASILSWSFTLIAGILAGLGFGTMAQFVPQMIGKK